MSPARLVRRAVDEFEAGAVEAVVLVLNGASMGTRWLRPLLPSGALVCVHTPRVKYVDRWGVEQKRPTFWSATAYLGSDPHLYRGAFLDHGTILCKVGSAVTA